MIMEDINYSLLPERLQSGVKRYIEQGIRPGDFLTAVICNKLWQSSILADDANIKRLFSIVNFFYNETPGHCWGSVKDMDAWIEHKGQEGIN